MRFSVRDAGESNEAEATPPLGLTAGIGSDGVITDPDGHRCEDRISNIAGSLSCKAFLRSFAYQYCHHKYIKSNCCASHEVYCRRGRSNLRRGRLLVFRSNDRNATVADDDFADDDLTVIGSDEDEDLGQGPPDSGHDADHDQVSKDAPKYHLERQQQLELSALPSSHTQTKSVADVDDDDSRAGGLSQPSLANGTNRRRTH